jgi:hypothetical protein
MAEGSDELERLSREQLILKARVLGAERPELMTRVELRDEIVRRSEPDLVKQKRARGFLGVARDLVASVVEAGLNLPDAAALIRGEGSRESEWKGPPPVATVTLAEIYASQGHLERALRMLDEVLVKEPDHDPARALRDRLAAGEMSSPSPRKRVKVSFADPPVEFSPRSEPASEPSPADEPVSDFSPADEPTSDFSPADEPASHSVPVTDSEAVAVVTADPTFAVSAAAIPIAEPVVSTSPSSRPESAQALPQDLALVTLSVAGSRQIYWEIPDRTWHQLRAHAPSGRALLRVVSFRARAGKVDRQTLEFSPHVEVGSAILPGFSADSVVRAALGWEVEGRFRAFALASDLNGTSGAGQFHPHRLVGTAAAEVARRAQSHFDRRA